MNGHGNEKREHASAWKYLFHQPEFWNYLGSLSLILGVFGVGVVLTPANMRTSLMIYGGVAVLIFTLPIFCIATYVLVAGFLRRKAMQKIANEVGATVMHDLTLEEVGLGSEFRIDKDAQDPKVLTYVSLHPNTAIVDYREARPAHWIIRGIGLGDMDVGNDSTIRSHYTVVLLGDEFAELQSRCRELRGHIRAREKHVYFRPSSRLFASRLLPWARVLEIAKVLQRSS